MASNCYDPELQLVQIIARHVDSRSKAEFLAKMGIVLEEADETLFWLELLLEAEIVPVVKLEGLIKEADELTAIFVSSLRTAKGFAA